MIVQFLEALEDEEPVITYCVIPAAWVETEDGADFARWPPTSTSEKEMKAIESMIRNGTPACTEWPVHIVIEKTPEIGELLCGITLK